MLLHPLCLAPGAGRSGKKRMRWPIQTQLFFPMLLTVVLAIGLASMASSYYGATRMRRHQQDNLHRVVATLTDAEFPLTEKVLRQMAGLSGAEFVLLNEREQVVASTLKLEPDERPALQRIPIARRPLAGSGTGLIELGGRSYLSHRAWLRGGSRGPSAGSLVVLYEEDRWRWLIWQAASPALLAGGIATGVAAILAMFLARRMVRPIHQLGIESARIAEGDFQPGPVPLRDDEIRDLALAINRMAQRLSQYEQNVRSSERLRVLGQLGAGMAHQLRNSATGARMAIELHQRACSAQADSESLPVALRQLRLMETYLQRFMGLGRDAPAECQTVSLPNLIDEVLELVRPACVHGKINLSYRRPDEPFDVRGDANSLRELLMNLVLNAVEAAKRPTGASARVAIELCRHDADQALLRVFDSGAGPAPSVRDRLFEPFVSEKPEGTGLGLFVARRVAEAHHGSLRWERVDGMTCFVVDLPLIPLDSSYGPPVGG
jgi:signal transduction histidine kinase